MCQPTCPSQGFNKFDPLFQSGNLGSALVIHFTPCSWSSFLLDYGDDSTARTYRGVFICSSVDRHLGCFLSGAVSAGAVLRIPTRITWWMNRLSPLYRVQRENSLQSPERGESPFKTEFSMPCGRCLSLYIPVAWVPQD